MALTAEEITAINNELTATDYGTAGSRRIATLLNEDGSAQTETWVMIADRTVDVGKAAILAKLTDSELNALLTWMDDSTVSKRIFKLLFDSAAQFTVNHDRFISMANALEAEGVISAESKGSVLRFGQRRLSRAEELIGRKITADEVQEALNG